MLLSPLMLICDSSCSWGKENLVTTWLSISLLLSSSRLTFPLKQLMLQQFLQVKFSLSFFSLTQKDRLPALWRLLHIGLTLLWRTSPIPITHLSRLFLHVISSMKHSLIVRGGQASCKNLLVYLKFKVVLIIVKTVCYNCLLHVHAHESRTQVFPIHGFESLTDFNCCHCRHYHHHSKTHCLVQTGCWKV